MYAQGLDAGSLKSLIWVIEVGTSHALFRALHISYARNVAPFSFFNPLGSAKHWPCCAQQASFSLLFYFSNNKSSERIADQLYAPVVFPRSARAFSVVWSGEMV